MPLAQARGSQWDRGFVCGGMCSALITVSARGLVERTVDFTVGVIGVEDNCDPPCCCPSTWAKSTTYDIGGILFIYLPLCDRGRWPRSGGIDQA